MKINPALAALSAAAAAAAVSMAGAAFASADADVQYLGQPGALDNGSVVQHWTITGLKPSTDAIPYQPAGQLWEATATDEAISGSVTPIVSNLNARAKNGDTYRVLFGVATPQGVNPATLTQGEKTTGKIYFDVTGEKPDSVFYSAGGPEELLWVEAPPAPPTGSTGGHTPSWTGRSPSASSAAETSTPATPTPGATPAGATPASSAPAAAPVPAASVGTPLPAGSSGTPLPAGSAGTPLPAGAAAPVEQGPPPVPAAVNPAPAGSAGTPLPAGSSGTPLQGAAPAAGPPAPAPAGAAPVTTVVAPPPAG